MSKPLSAHRHVQTEEYGRALISPFGGYVHVPVPAPVHAAPDLARVARTTLNPTKAAAGHAEMDRRGHGAYGTGASYTFRDRVGGVMPGYSGHRPGARDVDSKMAFGGVPTFNPPRMTRPPGQGEHLHQRPSTSFQELGKGWKVPAQELSTDQFRDAVGGVLCGYTGFVPNSRTHHGSAHVGGLARVGHRGYQAQRGHQGVTERMQADRALDLSSRTLRAASPVVGYQGHLPKAIDAFGTSFWRSESPDVGKYQAELYSA